ncbi:MAG: glycosyltransferase family 2 protein [Candidatus Fonsibacter ubiquis]
MISIITGTLNRKNFLPDLIENTVDSNKKLELVLVDGGSSDGTVEFLKEISHPQIKLIELGKRSPYPHYMNIAIQNSSYEMVCQWNDDVLLSNDWNEVIDSIDDEYDFYLFNWRYGNKLDLKNPNWMSGNNHLHGWCLLNNIETPVDGNDEIVVNYGIYKKKIFRKIGMYSHDYQYYYADADMANRSYRFGFKPKNLREIKVCSLYADKVAKHYPNDEQIYNKNRELYKIGVLPNSIEMLK